MREFKARRIKSKKNKKRKVRLVIFTFFFFFSYMFMIKYLRSNQIKETILKEDINYINFDFQKEISDKIDEVINKPVSLLNQNVKNAKKVKFQTNKKDNDNKTTEVISEVNEVKEENKEPLIYVYNTHQTEEYNGFSVYDAASLLTNKLNDSGVSSYLEEQSIKVFLEQNNFKYSKSYTASRKYLNEAISNYTSLKYFFDIHRDSVSKSISTITYNGKSFAKVLFVVGLDNSNNEKNNSNAEKLNDVIKSKVPGISRGIAKHGGKGYNGVYNQDISENVFLIEVGGKDNTKEEVENTINVIYESILEYIRGVV